MGAAGGARAWYPGTMAKRAFVRKRGVLSDSYEDPPGQKCKYSMPATMAGEELPEEQRAQILSDARLAVGSAYGMHEDRSPELLGSLLEGVAEFNCDAPMNLTRFLDDPRVQPALVHATADVPASRLANFAQVVGMIGGPGAREVLRKRLDDLVQDPATFDDHAFFNHKAGSLVTTACSLLALEPDADAPADALLRLVEHPCGFNRRSACWNAATLVSKAPATSTPPVRRLRTAIVAIANTTDDDDLFLYVCDASHAHLVRDRLQKLLTHESYDLRHRAIIALSRGPDSTWGLARLRERLPHEPSLRLRFSIARSLAPLLPPSDLTALLDEALANESPSLRFQAIGLLDALPKPAASEVAARALADEPDPALERLLRAHLTATPAP